MELLLALLSPFLMLCFATCAEVSEIYFWVRARRGHQTRKAQGNLLLNLLPHSISFIFQRMLLDLVLNRAFLHDVTAAMLLFQNKEMAAMMVYQTNSPGIELYFYANTFFFQ